MSLTNSINPATYSAGYSAIPMRGKSSLVDTVNKHNYLINILYNEDNVISSSVYPYNNFTYTNLFTGLSHPYKLGDVILLTDSNDTYTGYYNIVEVPDNQNIVIDMTLGAPMSGTITTYNTIPYTWRPDLQGEFKVDFKGTLKDFVTENLEDNDDCIAAPDTIFEYKIMIGEEFEYVFDFDDNFFGTSGNVGFVNLSLTQSQFIVGDQIVVNQDLFQWSYDDNFFDALNVGFTSSNSQNFRDGQQITVTGQITHQSYNGQVSILDSGNPTGSSTYLVTNKPYVSSTPVEGGIITGIPFPEYNTTCTVTEVIAGATGTYITTDVPFVSSSEPIGGEITFVDILTKDIDLYLSDTKSVYNARQNTLDYTIDGFDPYVTQVRSSDENFLSTILGTNDSYRIELESKSWLLNHSYQTGYTDLPYYIFYDKAGSVISELYMNNFSGNFKDYYLPIGVDQIINNLNTVLVSGSALSTVRDDIVSYTVHTGAFGDHLRTVKYNFFINTDCSMYEQYSLMWKDSRGSWLSYPFKYISTDITEVERKNYYKTEENWDLNGTGDFGYDSFGRGEKTYFSRNRDKIVLNSGWVSEYENLLIKDLMVSPNVFVQSPDGKLVAAIIENKDIQFGNEMNDQIFNYTFKVKYSRNDIRL